MNWLNANAPAVQASAAVATLLVTVALAALTSRYVRLTKSIADTAAAQQRALEQAQLRLEEGSRRALAAHAIRLRATLALLGVEVPREGELRTQFLLVREDLSQLEQLAREADSEAQREANACSIAVRWLIELAERVRRVNPSHGYRFSEDETETYRDSVREGTTALDSLIARLAPSPPGDPAAAA